MTTARHYIDKNGKRWVQVGNFWKLSATMMIKYGKNWKKQCLGSYGFEQLFENKYDRNGRKI